MTNDTLTTYKPNTLKQSPIAFTKLSLCVICQNVIFNFRYDKMRHKVISGCL